MARRLYYCEHTWVGASCRRCGIDRAAVELAQTMGRPRNGGLPDWATGLPDRPSLHVGPETAITTVTFDPWVTAPLGPSIAVARPEAGLVPPDIDAAAEERMLVLVNQARAAQGLRPLVMDEAVRAVARRHSADMRDRGYFEHQDPEGQVPADRAQAAGIRFRLFGENISMGAEVGAAHEALMNSAGHRANILHPDYGRIGIGIVRRRGGPYVTQNFAD